ncbi:polymorphic toxin-type HINT domain-containing protein [Streptomyces sp. NPDC021020]|uniref:polymorphic toxin-type HINT domain-containing protein n=1 Tax=Streptomyces sp. NPDC021020 TaxID=3365109 RepID=UPI00379FE560
MTRARSSWGGARGKVSLLVSGLLVAGVLQGAALPLAHADDMPGKPSAGRPVAGHSVTTTAPRATDGLAHHPAQSPERAWAAPGSATVALPAGSGKAVAVRAGKLPVTLTAAAASAKPAASAPSARAAALTGSATVRVLGQDAAQAAGVDGLLFSVTPQPGAVGSTVGVRVDDSAYAQAYGGAYAARLHLVTLPACALTTPGEPSCTRQTPLPTGNDTATHTLSADAVAVAPALAPASRGLAAGDAAATSGAVVLAATTGASSDQGDYKATSLSASATFDVGLNTGDFSWSYDMPAPDVPSGFSPSVGLSYNSGGVDGRTSGTNNQASWAGDGFDLWPGSIERSYKPCADEGVKDSSGNKVGDLCWAGDNASISFNGHSGQLVATGTNSFRIKGDDGTKVDRLYGDSTNVRANGAHNDEYWRVTTTDGTRYYFGYNRLTGWASGNATTNSTWTVPVYGNNSGEPCNATTFAASWCQQGWRWNLDYAIDAHGNGIAYFYNKETNYYGRDNTASSPTSYDRGGSLDHIEYGVKYNAMYSSKALAKVNFTSAERCLETTSGTCDAAKIDTAPSYWYDTPWDLNCKSTGDCHTFSPTFFTRKRLTTVTTQVLKADGSYTPVDQWDLTQQWGMADIDYQLELASIQHTGKADTPEGAPDISLPKVTFGYDQRTNRLDIPGDNTAPFIKERLSTVDDESGGQIDVTYSTAACDAAHLPTVDSNTTLCFPQFFTKQGDSDPTLQWFNKYVVKQVIQTDRTKTSPDMVTTYDYLGGAAWHYDSDDNITREKYKTWSTFRGYAHVRVETGGEDPVGMLSQEDHYFLRGMDADKTSSGTRSVSVSDDNGGTITDHDSLSGFEYKSEQYSGPGGKVLGKTVNTPWHHQTASVTRSWGTIAANLTGTAETRTWTSLDNGAGSSWRTTDVQNTFEDTAGRILTTDDQGDISTHADDRCTRTTYVDNTTAWILDAPTRIQTLSVGCSATPDYSEDVVSDVRTAYDGQGYGVAPTTGNPTHVATMSTNNGTTVTYLESGSTYDTYGRVVSTTDITGNVTATETGTPTRTDRADGRTTTTVYSPATGFPKTTAVTSPPATAGNSATAQTTTTTLDPVRGLPTTAVDANGKQTDTAYDALGRNLKIWLADRPKNANPTPSYAFSYTFTDGKPIAVGTTTLSGTGTKTGYVFYDGFLRERQAQAPGPDGGMLVADTFYDARGLTAQTYAPYYATKAPSTALYSVDDVSAVETQTRNTYDGLGRVVQSKQMAGGTDGGTVLSTTTTSYGGDRTTVTPPQGGTPTTTITDARGNTSELDQYHASTPTGAFDRTRYEYNPAGMLSKVTDPAGNVWSYTYDQRGNQVTADDPDTGTTRSSYDDRGQLLTTTDQLGATVARVYDGLGRETQTRDGGTTGPLLTEHVWDPVGAKGQLASATRYAGGAAYSVAYKNYDNLYRPHGTTTTIPATEGALAGSYQSTVQYNPDGTTQSVGYPAAGALPAEALTPTYDDLLRPVELSGSGGATYITDTVYSNDGRPLQYTYKAAGQKMTQVTNTYQWGTQRLSNSRVDRQDVPGTDKSATYGYDQAGDVTSITDVSRDGTDAQCFDYDYLARLTKAWAQGAAGCATTPSSSVLGGPAPYWQSFTYNLDGGRHTETDHSLTGDPAQDTVRTSTYPTVGSAHAHALSQVDTTGPTGTSQDTYTYDADGNTQTHLPADGNKQTYTWDSEGHLSTVSTDDGAGGTTTTSYVYDADGNRLITRTPTTTTLFLGATEITLGLGSTTPKATRYYDLGSGNLAVRTDDNKLSFVISDHHGTGQLAIDATTQAMQQTRTTPFGASRGTEAPAWPGDKGFVGGTEDPTTGLTHLGARDYDPTTGRFISVDPVLDPGNPQQLNGYTYSNNNPATLDDPSGAYPTPSGGPTTYPCTQKFICAPSSANTNPINNGGGGGGGGHAPAASTVKRQATPAEKILSKIPPKRLDVLRQDIAMYIRESPDTWNVPGSFAYNAMMLRIDDAVHGDLKWSEIWNSLKGPAVGLTVSVVGSLLCLDDDGNGCYMAVAAASSFASSCVEDCSDTEGIALNVAVSVALAYGGAKIPGLRATGTCNSFSPDTEVLLADGKTKEIKDLRTGDEVSTGDPATGRSAGSHKVTGTLINHDDNLVDVAVTTSDGHRSVLHTTTEHLFWSETDSAWLPAADLRSGQKLGTASGLTVSVVAVHVLPGPAKDMYNLTVSDLHTYYVMAGAAPVLVHNDNDVPRWAADEIARIKAGQGTPRTESLTDPTQKLYQGNESARHAAKWGPHADSGFQGSPEWEVPGKGNTYRIVGPNRFGEYGYTDPIVKYKKITVVPSC